MNSLPKKIKRKKKNQKEYKNQIILALKKKINLRFFV